MEWVAITLHTTLEHGVSNITTADAHTSAVSSRKNDVPTDLNGLVRFAERRNLVSARVRSHFKRSLTLVAIENPRYRTSCTDVMRMRFYERRSYSHPSLVVHNAATLNAPT